MRNPYNEITLIGRLTRDPEYTAEGTPRVNFSLAVDRMGKKDGDKADFPRCVAWDSEKVKTATQIRDYFTKGKPIIIRGRLENDPYTDKEGRLRESWSIKVDSWAFVPSDPTQKQKANTVTETDSFKAAEDDIPF